MLQVPIEQTAVPYLHITLGVVKKHDQLLEQRCDEIDQMIAEERAELMHKHEIPN